VADLWDFDQSAAFTPNGLRMGETACGCIDDDDLEVLSGARADS
jgi:hypothetical protein